MRNGQGKDYNEEGILIYDGEYLKGYRNGQGKEYTNDGKLKFEGEFLDNQIWNGYGKK